MAVTDNTSRIPRSGPGSTTFDDDTLNQGGETDQYIDAREITQGDYKVQQERILLTGAQQENDDPPQDVHTHAHAGVDANTLHVAKTPFATTFTAGNIDVPDTYSSATIAVNAKRASLYLFNSGNEDIYVGSSVGVSSANSFLLPSGVGITDTTYVGAYFFRSASGTPKLYYMEHSWQ